MPRRVSDVPEAVYLLGQRQALPSQLTGKEYLRYWRTEWKSKAALPW
jgi:hypothetical protein